MIDGADLAAERQPVLFRKPKSDAEMRRAVGIRPRRLGRTMCVVTIEDTLQPIQCKTRSAVLYRDDRPAAFELQANHDLSPYGRKADRVVHQVLQDRFQGL